MQVKADIFSCYKPLLFDEFSAQVKKEKQSEIFEVKLDAEHRREFLAHIRKM